MDIMAIEEAIQTLENDDTTFDNVSELASLYICRQYMNKPLNLMVSGTQKELEDILPYYMKYTDIKKRYQLNQTSEGEVIQGIKNVCREIQEFIETLYSGTDMNKERLCIAKTLEQLYKKYSK